MGRERRGKGHFPANDWGGKEGEEDREARNGQTTPGAEAEDTNAKSISDAMLLLTTFRPCPPLALPVPACDP